MTDPQPETYRQAMDRLFPGVDLHDGGDAMQDPDPAEPAVRHAITRHPNPRNLDGGDCWQLWEPLK